MAANRRWGYQQFSEPTDWHVQAEVDLGRPLSAASCYFKLDAAAQFVTNDGVTHMNAVNGGLVYCNINSVVGVDKTPVDYADIRAGKYDAALAAWGGALGPYASSGKALIVTWQHEPSVDSSTQPKTGDWSGPAYQETFRYVHDKVNAAAGVALRWGFYPVVENYRPHDSTGHLTADDFYPGDAYIRVMGADLYYHVGSADDTVTKAQALVSYAQAHGKPIGIGECGDDDATGREARLTALTSYLLSCGSVIAHLDWNAKDGYGLSDHTGTTYDAWLAAAKGWR